MIHIWCPWKLSNFQEPPPPCPSLSKILQSPWPWMLDIQFIANLIHSLQMIICQLKENIIHRWILSKCYQVLLHVGFHFQYQLINLIWLSFDFFSFSWSLTICYFVALYSCVSSCQLCSIIHIFSTYLLCLCACSHKKINQV